MKVTEVFQFDGQVDVVDDDILRHLQNDRGEFRTPVIPAWTALLATSLPPPRQGRLKIAIRTLRL